MHALSPLDLNILYVLTLHAQRPKTIASALHERYKARSNECITTMVQSRIERMISLNLVTQSVRKWTHITREGRRLVTTLH